MNWQSHLENTSKWRNMSSYLQCTDSQLQKRGDVAPLATLSLFTLGTCELMFTAVLYEFHTLWMTSCIDSLTSYIQHAMRAEDKTFHMSICVITWGKRLWLIIIIGPRRRQEHIRACCWLKYHVVMFFPLMISAIPLGWWSQAFTQLTDATCENKNLMLDEISVNLERESMFWTTGTYSRNMLSKTILHCSLSGRMLRSLVFIVPFNSPST